MRHRQRAVDALAALVILAATGCTAGAPPAPAPSPTATLRSTPTSTTSAPPLPSATGPCAPVGQLTAVTTGLDAPWSIAQLADDGVLVSERNTGVVKKVRSDGSAGGIGTVPGVVHAGEGGLLGIAVHQIGGTRYLYAYLTSATDNRIVRMPLLGTSGAYGLGEAEPVLTGIAKASNHDGGRIKFGPDGMLYATTGDASQTASAQDPTSLNGKILRMTPDGGVPPDNPIAGSLTYSYGHRNPQGIAWDADGQLWAAEFGQDTWDELNRIEPGGNYGWPTVEGIAHDSRFIDPVHEWPTDDASPSGLAICGHTAFMAGLGGQRLWVIDLDNPQDANALFAGGEIGRVRDVVVDGESLLLLSNNTDGRGRPRPDDDVMYRLPLVFG